MRKPSNLLPPQEHASQQADKLRAYLGSLQKRTFTYQEMHTLRVRVIEVIEALQRELNTTRAGW